MKTVSFTMLSCIASPKVQARLFTFISHQSHSAPPGALPGAGPSIVTHDPSVNMLIRPILISGSLGTSSLSTARRLATGRPESEIVRLIATGVKADASRSSVCRSHWSIFDVSTSTDPVLRRGTGFFCGPETETNSLWLVASACSSANSVPPGLPVLMKLKRSGW